MVGLSKGSVPMTATPISGRLELPAEREAAVRSDRSWAMPYLVQFTRSDNRPFLVAIGACAVAFMLRTVALAIPIAQHQIMDAAWATVATAALAVIVQVIKVGFEWWRDREQREQLRAEEERRLATLAKTIENMEANLDKVDRKVAAQEGRYDELCQMTAHQEELYEEARRKRHDLRDDVQVYVLRVNELEREVVDLKGQLAAALQLAAHPPTVNVNVQGKTEGQG